jgi:hypothetical protein
MLIEDSLKFALVIPTYEGTAYLNLRRSMCLTESRSAPDEQFFTRLGNQSSHESAQLKIIVECVLRHPQSY